MYFSYIFVLLLMFLLMSIKMWIKYVFKTLFFNIFNLHIGIEKLQTKIYLTISISRVIVIGISAV